MYPTKEANMLKIKTYERRSFDVEAVQVTMENIVEVAAWCSGQVCEIENKTDNNDRVPHYIKVAVHRPANSRQTRAHIGDWVLRMGHGYKVYTTEAFERCFKPRFNTWEDEVDHNLNVIFGPVDPKSAVLEQNHNMVFGTEVTNFEVDEIKRPFSLRPTPIPTPLMMQQWMDQRRD